MTALLTEDLPRNSLPLPGTDFRENHHGSARRSLIQIKDSDDLPSRQINAPIPVFSGAT
jgi:hypothetical protein